MSSQRLSAVPTMQAIDARNLAFHSHGSQIDRDGRLHFDHLERVAAMVPESHRRVAWLHDVLEDTDLGIPDLEAAGLPEDEVRAVRLLTRIAHQSYDSYIGSICNGVGDAGMLARRVKEADLLDNLRRCLEADDDLQRRYRAALPRIQQAMVGR